MNVKEATKVNRKKNKGITLIALVITIIVLLILAGISIAMLTGDNGILAQAAKSKEETENAKSKEQSILDSYEDIINASTAITGGEWNEEKGVNTPAINENINMQLVRYEDGEWVEDETDSSYNYVAGSGTTDNNSSEWANAKVTIDGVDSYFVWIPRYAYKINYNVPGDVTSGGTIDVKFLKGTSNVASDGTICKYADDNTLNKEEDYIIHPTFTSNVDLGGWRTELTGIWVGKYESSLVNKSDGSNIVTSDEKTGNILLSNNTDKAIAVQSGMSSWRYCTIGNMYTNARIYAESMNSHMLKNSEWGAVAYLTYSSYGRNGHDISASANTDGNYLTADGDIEKNASQSATGNIYGIYDLAGDGYERLAAYYTGGNSIYLNDTDVFSKGISNEFVTVYRGSKIETSYIIGDATYETFKWNFGWIDVDLDYPLFQRGAKGFSGVLGYSRNNGDAGIGSTFRICLVTK